MKSPNRNYQALARAIYAKERVLLLDDVFSSIDAAFISIITDRLFSPNGILTKNKATVILATHNRKLRVTHFE